MIIYNGKTVSKLYKGGVQIKKAYKNGIKVYDVNPIAVLPASDTSQTARVGEGIFISYSCYADGEWASINLYYEAVLIAEGTSNITSNMYITLAGYNKGSDMYSSDGHDWYGEYLNDTIIFNLRGTYTFIGKYTYNGIEYNTGKLTITVL